MKNTQKLSIVLILILVAPIVVIASAVVYQLQISNSYDATVGERTVQIPMSLTGNGTLLLEGDYIKLTATVTDANGVGKVVTFKEGATTVGTATITDFYGIYKAEYTYQPSLGSHTWTANPTP